ncbi:hypothetical protein PGIGA_G00220460 [Pangasianodon gigas]|uniref:Uncharacterized protein n=1 Tax=Pangasianodon gigas TaxID=30993 RepID=A0ACC5WIE7_PANGG|nr:hypothetical protein [Pangasianodon gigas]
MGEEFIRELLSLCLHRLALEQNTHSELELIEVVRNFEVVRKKWLHAELELKKYKELLVKSDVARAALEVKLKHARNQVDVEIKKRYKVEADYQYLERQMLLMTEILAQDSKSNACLNEEQRNMLASFHPRGANVTQHRGKRLSVIDESSFLSHSDISYDRTDDDLDLDSAAVVKPLKSRPREKRRSSLGPIVGLPIQKRGRLGGRSGDLLSVRPSEKEVEATVVTASVTTPDNGGQIHMVIDITQEMPEPIRTQADILPSVSEQTSVWAHSEITEVEMVIAQMDETSAEPKVPPSFNPTVDSNVQHTNVQHVNIQSANVQHANVQSANVQHANVQHNTVQHVFLPKTVIRPETCTQCKKRIRFGKVAVKCRDCRVIAHPECKHMCVEKCFPNTQRTVQPSEETLEGLCPSTPPRIPALIVQCVKEIERRGLEEKGLYRVPGGERAVKELRERYLSAKGPLLLHRVDEIHVVIRPETCTQCKKRIRFGKVAVKCRDCRVIAHPECKHMCVEKCFPNTQRTVQPSEETLEGLCPSTPPRIPALIVQCVKEIERRGLEEKGLYRVPGGERAVKELRERYLSAKGPLLLHRVDEIHVVCGLLKDFLRKLREPLVTFKLHKTFMEAAEPSPLTIMRDTNTQPKVVLRLLSFPADYWKSLLTAEDQPRSHTHSGRDQPRSHTHSGRDQPRSHTHSGRDQPRSHTHPERDQLISSVIHSNISSSTPSTDRDRMFKPVTSPELSKYSRTPGGSSIKGRIKTLGNAFNNPTKPRPEPAKKKFFTSPK